MSANGACPGRLAHRFNERRPRRAALGYRIPEPSIREPDNQFDGGCASEPRVISQNKYGLRFLAPCRNVSWPHADRFHPSGSRALRLSRALAANFVPSAARRSRFGGVNILRPKSPNFGRSCPGCNFVSAEWALVNVRNKLTRVAANAWALFKISAYGK